MSDYHKDTAALTKTALTVFCDSPREYYLQFVTQDMERKATTAAMSKGTVLHAMLLENKPLNEIVGVYPESCLRSDGGLNWKPAAQYRQDNPDKLGYFKQDAAEDIQIVYDAIKDTCIATAIEESSHLEEVFEATVHGRLCKCKPDIAGDVGEYWCVYDLKFMDRIYPKAFWRSSKNFRYYLQDSHYSGVITTLYQKPVVFRFIACELLYPYRVQMYQYDPRSREIARDYHRKKVNELIECERTGDWSDKWNGDLTLNPWDVEGCGEGDGLEWEDEKVEA